MLKRITLAALGASLLAGPVFAAQEGSPPPRRDPLTMADQNKDGLVTREEMLASVATRFAAMDANRDGKVTPDERDAYQAQERARMAGRMMPKRDLTLADEQSRATRMFDRIDANHDGKIDAAERQAVAQRMMQMRGGGGGWRGRQGPPPGDMPPPPPPPGDAD